MNPSKAKSPRQWLIWKASGAVHLHSNPAIARTLRRFAREELAGTPVGATLSDHVTPPQSGDLVIHIPADGSRGSGPVYVDWVNRPDDTVTVSLLVYGPMAWMRSLPIDEMIVVGHVDISYSDRLGNAFTRESLARIRPATNAAKAEFYRWFPTFEDGRTEILLSQMQSSKIHSGYIADGTTTEPTNPDFSWNGPGTVVQQTVYATPREGCTTYIEATAHDGKFLVVTTDDERRAYYVMLRWS